MRFYFYRNRLEEHLENGGLTPIAYGFFQPFRLEEHLKNGVEHLKKGVLTPSGPFAVILEGLEEQLKKGGLTYL